MAYRGCTRSTWEPDNSEDNGLSESSSGNNLSSRSPSVETVVETDDEATDHLSLKLNRLTDKLCRYESHKYFITKCLKENLIPEGFWSLYPSIGNHDDEFLKNWYEDVHNFLLNKMQDTINFCDKTITETKANINQTEDEMKKTTVPSNLNLVKEELKKNKEGYSAQLLQKKIRKFRNLKYKGNRRKKNGNSHTSQASNRNNNSQPKQTYSQVLQTEAAPHRQDARASENPSHGQKTTFKGRTPFNIGKPPQIKPMTSV